MPDQSRPVFGLAGGAHRPYNQEEERRKEEAPDRQDNDGSDYRTNEPSPSICIVPTRLLSKRGSDESPGISEKGCHQEARGLLPSWGDQPRDQTYEKPEECSPQEVQ